MKYYFEVSSLFFLCFFSVSSLFLLYFFFVLFLLTSSPVRYYCDIAFSQYNEEEEGNRQYLVILHFV